MKHPKVGEIWQVVDRESKINKLILVSNVVEDVLEHRKQYLHVHAFLLDGFEPETVKGHGEYSCIMDENSYHNFYWPCKIHSKCGSCFKFVKRIEEKQ